MKNWQGVSPKQDKHDLCACGARIVEKLFTSVVCAGAVGVCPWAAPAREVPTETSPEVLTWHQCYHIMQREFANPPRFPSVFQVKRPILGWMYEDPSTCSGGLTTEPWRSINLQEMSATQALNVNFHYTQSLGIGLCSVKFEAWDVVGWEWVEMDVKAHAHTFDIWRVC